MTDRKIDDVSSNDMSFKHLETTKDIIITPKNQFGNSVYLDATHTWTAKVSDGTNYVGDYPVTIDSTNIVVNSSDFTKLPAGNYHLEVWEEWIGKDDKQQRSIYPSPQQTVDFTIYQSIPDLAEKDIKRIGFQNVVDQAVMNIGMNYVFKVNTIEADQKATVVQAASDGKNYVTFNIPRGAKGDKGAQGIQGPVGPAPIIHIGQVTKLEPNQAPSLTLDGKDGNYTLNAGLPQGQTGATGPMPVITIGNVATLPAGSPPQATISKTDNGYAINLALPAGFKPQRGTDYWTDDDKKSIQTEDQQYIDSKVTDAYAKAKNDVDAGLPFRWQQRTYNTPLNNLTQEGFYYGTGLTFSNKPGDVQRSDKLKVIVLNPTGDDATQFCLVNGILWKRDNFNNSWTDWKKLGESN